jgi:hypothetical protein
MSTKTFEIRFPDNVLDKEPDFLDNAFRTIQAQGRIVRIEYHKVYSYWKRHSGYRTLETMVDEIPLVEIEEPMGTNSISVEVV